jgi:predicted nucleic acid-binding protein
VVEEGSDIAAELWNEDLVAASSILSYPEGRAALAAARRAGRLTATQHADATTDFEDIQRELLTLGVDESLTRDAGQLAQGLGLRGYDAVHLATALALEEGNVTVVSWDEDLSRAAERSGLAVAPAGDLGLDAL